ncbi:MAG: hypothetical protein H8D23_28470, partial [Candidatus Brocadiales bacterium]|nr:hypothetical protein [Candidatus Brocadiales bacterium]
MIKIIHSDIAEYKLCEGLNIFLLNDGFVNDMGKDESDLIFCSDNINVVICVNGSGKSNISEF